MTRILVSICMALFCCMATASAVENDEGWGVAENGLQIRVSAVELGTDEQKPDWENAERIDRYDSASEITLLVQIKNVSSDAIKLRGVRYDDNVSGAWSGRSQQSKFGPRCFSFQLIDESGEVIELPEVKEKGPSFFDSAVELLAPQEVLTMVTTPLAWSPTAAATLDAGNYRLKMTYRGYGENEWKGRVSGESPPVEVLAAYRDVRHSLVWGPAKDGLRVAAEYRLADTRAELLLEFQDRVYPIDSKIAVRFHFQNVTDEPIELDSAVWRQDDQVFHVTDRGENRLDSSWYSGMTPIKTWTLQPKQIVVIPAIAMGFCQSKSKEDLTHPIGPVVKSEPGEIKIRHELQGGLSTGASIITLRERKPEDDPPKIAASLKFKMPKGEFASQGYVRITTNLQRLPLFDGELSGETLELDSWTGGELRVLARIPGCQEEVFQFVRPDRHNIIELSPSLITKLRFVDVDGIPVEGVKLRQFAWTHTGSKGYPFPSKGIRGDVLGVSDAMGKVSLDSLDGGNGKRTKIYTFYAEPAEGLAPVFVGPVESGTSVGDVQLSPLLEVSGVIEGTREQLENFAAEWDQPTGLILDDGTVSSLYAVSVKLDVWREDDHLAFRLKNLRPGNLRIIANFDPRPHRISHTSGRRDVKGADVLVEIELIESRDDLVIKPDSGD